MISNFVFSKKILIWYRNATRANFPWQLNKTMYTVWLSEIMLQQTQVTTVIPYYKKFLEKFPTISKLASANLDEVLYIWSGLGYYKRAINLYETAKIIMQYHNGIFPQDFNTILSFPGIGKSTAGAILSLTLNQRYPILDGNVKRILIRYYSIDPHKIKKSIMQKQLWTLIEQLIPDTNIAIFNQALMNLGRLICTYKNPLCNTCPIHNTCKTFSTNNIHQYTQKKIIQKKTTQIIWWLLLWFKQNKTIWLTKRSQSKIWKELFCFPEFSNIDMLNIWLIKHNLSLNQCHNMNLLKHNISNIKLKIHPILLNINSCITLNKECGIWYDLNQPATIGLPKPVSLILNYLISHIT